MFVPHWGTSACAHASVSLASPRQRVAPPLGVSSMAFRRDQSSPQWSNPILLNIYTRTIYRTLIRKNTCIQMISAWESEANRLRKYPHHYPKTWTPCSPTLKIRDWSLVRKNGFCLISFEQQTSWYNARSVCWGETFTFCLCSNLSRSKNGSFSHVPPSLGESKNECC